MVEIEPKHWNRFAKKWETSWIVLKIIRFSIYEIVRGYPERRYIVDKTYGISLNLNNG